MLMQLVSVEGCGAARLDSLSQKKRKQMHATPSEDKNEEMGTAPGSGTWEALS